MKEAFEQQRFPVTKAGMFRRGKYKPNIKPTTTRSDNKPQVRPSANATQKNPDASDSNNKLVSPSSSTSEPTEEQQHANARNNELNQGKHESSKEILQPQEASATNTPPIVDDSPKDGETSTNIEISTTKHISHDNETSQLENASQVENKNNHSQQSEIETSNDAGANILEDTSGISLSIIDTELVIDLTQANNFTGTVIETDSDIVALPPLNECEILPESSTLYKEDTCTKQVIITSDVSSESKKDIDRNENALYTNKEVEVSATLISLGQEQNDNNDLSRDHLSVASDSEPIMETTERNVFNPDANVTPPEKKVPGKENRTIKKEGLKVERKKNKAEAKTNGKKGTTDSNHDSVKHKDEASKEISSAIDSSEVIVVTSENKTGTASTEQANVKVKRKYTKRNSGEKKKRRDQVEGSGTVNSNGTPEKSTAKRAKKPPKEKKSPQRKLYHKPSKRPRITGPIDESTMTIGDLVFYQKEERKPIPRTKKARKANAPVEVVLSPIPTPNATNNSNAMAQESRDNDENHEVMAPQVMVAEDGSIIIKESSLYVQQTKVKQGFRETVYEDEDSSFNPYQRRKLGSKCKWSLARTLQFYRALSQVGTDFTLMMNIFPNETRRRLKRKFKWEEKINGDLVDKALENRLPMNFADLLGQDVNTKEGGEGDKNGNGEADENEEGERDINEEGEKDKNMEVEGDRNQEGEGDRNEESGREKNERHGLDKSKISGIKNDRDRDRNKVCVLDKSAFAEPGISELADRQNTKGGVRKTEER